MESKPIDNNNTIKFLYSYGGKILPRHSDGKLRYCGGHTRVLTLHPSTSFSELMVKLNQLCGSPVTLKCPLPNGDLDTLISVTSDEDLANIIEEYGRASSSLPHQMKIRAILLPPKKSSPSSTTTHSPTGSPVAVAYPSGVRNGAAKGCWYTAQLDGRRGFLQRGPHWNNNYYCH